MNNTKKTISCFLAVASITSVTANVDNITKANNDVKVTTEPTQETGKVSAVVLETEQGAVIRVTAHTDVQKVKTTYTVDGTQAKTVDFGNLTKGQVKDIQINLGTQAPAVKSVKRLPNTAVVSERVEFAKTVKSHAIKGSVSFEYETAEVALTTPLVTPTVPTKPIDSIKPIKPVDTTKPGTPTKPVDTVKPTEPTKPVDVTKPAEPVKPVDTTKPVTPTKPVGTVKPTEPTKPVDVTKPAEPANPVDTTKPTEPAKPVEKPTTPVGTQPKDEPTTPTTPKEDNGTWKEETRTRTVTVDEEYTESTTEDVYKTKQLFDDFIDLVDGQGTLIKHLGWYSDLTDSQIGDELLAVPATVKDPKTIFVRKVRETKKVKVGTKTVPVTKVRKVQKQETYTVWVNSKTGEVRTSKPTVPTSPKEDNGTWKEETRTRTVIVDEEYTENTTEDVFEEKQLFDDWVTITDQNGKLLKDVGWMDDFTQSQIDDMLISLTTRTTLPQANSVRKVRETKKVKVGTKIVPVTKVRKVQKQETYTVWVNTKTGEVRTSKPTVPSTPKEDKGTWKEETRTRTVTVDEEYTENTTEDVFEEKQLFDQWLDIVDQNGKLLKAVGWSDDYTDDQISDMVLALTDRNTQAQSHEYRKVRETKKVKVGTKTVPVTKVRKVQKQETYTVWVNSETGEVRTERP